MPTAQPGKLAVIGDSSEMRPQPMTEAGVSGACQTKLKAITLGRKSRWRKGQRRRQPLAEADASTDNASVGPDSAAVGLKVDKDKAAVEPTNLLLPCFSSTYPAKEKPSMQQQMTSFLLRTSQPPLTHVLRAAKPPLTHVLRAAKPPRIRKALAIGMHGLVPAAFLRPMIGQPTGTSLRFAGLCAEAIRRWADAHGCRDCEIEKVALEGEGRIGDRVDNLWKLLLNWIDHIRRADLIIVASHSQGVPVSIMLLERLMSLGLVADVAKLGVCAMAGVALGPFADYRSSILMGSAAELWEFGNPHSSISQRFEDALRRVLEHGARVTFIGSINDQLMPMEVN